MTHTTSTPFFALFGQMAARAWRVFKHRRQFAELRNWTDEQLDDIGLTRAQVRRALDLPFYTDPTSRMASAPALGQSLALTAANSPRKTTRLKTVKPRSDESGPLAA
ncbi:DUF1127 domain-containing protein [Roseibium aggregatum]|uniref:DUF1127 domain-containing protein n=1 Tax=Roseibium aggregatum TaxID=187304 RepID=A0A939EBG1_9HYPH|nr:DUF1127 domain-containing protein [Roseibium aggregatum]MBN9669008.1 DUF1127 domain-containing protein [Roseibium aggregatum]